MDESFTEIVETVERLSKDELTKYTLDTYRDGSYEVCCLKANDKGLFNTIHWHRSYRDKARAIAEFNRFD